MNHASTTDAFDLPKPNNLNEKLARSGKLRYSLQLVILV